MSTKFRITLVTALAFVALAAPATAMYEPRDVRGEHSTSQGGQPVAEARTNSVATDLRSPDAVEPFVRPVIVEVDGRGSSGFDWTDAVIGAGIALAFAIAAAAIAGSRRRHPGPRPV